MPYSNETAPIAEIQRGLGRQIELFRMSRNMRQLDLANAAGISRATLSRIESGQGGTIDTMLRLMRALGIADRIGQLIPDASKSPLIANRDGEVTRERVRLPARREQKPWVWADETPGGMDR